MDKFSQKLRDLFRGIYGIDELSKFLQVLAIILLASSYIIKERSAAKILNSLGMTLLFVCLFRILSKNVPRRQAENTAFRKRFSPIIERFEILNMRIRDRKTHKYVKCDKCKNIMRVPKGKGKVKIRCKKCGNEFYKHV